MARRRPTILYLTDLTYQAASRRYCDEDIFLSSRLADEFTVALCAPLDAVRLMKKFDAVVLRNTGPVIHYKPAFDAFHQKALTDRVRVHNALTGRADILGKQYLVDLTDLGYPVIPTANDYAGSLTLPTALKYLVKPLYGADSCGVRVIDRSRLAQVDLSNDVVIQPYITFAYEVSFFFLDHRFQYALFAPDPARRWILKEYKPTADDLTFAHQFVQWNTVGHGIQRVDACRTPEGELLLVELEDLNPYLSLDLWDDKARELFIEDFKDSLKALLQA